MDFRTILKENGNIWKAVRKGNSVIVNDSKVYTYKFDKVAYAVAKQLRMFIVEK